MTYNQTNDQKQIIEEFINFATNDNSSHDQIIDIKIKEYDKKFGMGNAIELLNDNFYNIIRTKNLQKYQIQKLVKLIVRREIKWILKKLDNINYNDIVYDGHGFVIMTDGTRIDIEPDNYKREREEFNKIKTERLINKETNGLEFL